MPDPVRTDRGARGDGRGARNPERGVGSAGPRGVNERGTRVGARRPAAKRRAVNRAQVTFAALGLIVIVSMIFGLVAVGLADFRFGGDPTPEGDRPPYGSNLVPTYEAQVRANPNDVNTITVLANILQNQGDYPGAIAWYEKAVALQPDNVATRLAFGQALGAFGQRFDAEAQYRRVLELDSKNAQAEYYLGELYKTWNPPRPEEARLHYQRASDLEPEGNWGRAARGALERLNATPVPATATP